MKFRNNIARCAIGALIEHHSPWFRWFAWYPATDVGETFWLESIERRFVWLERCNGTATWNWEYRRSGLEDWRDE